MTLERAQKLVNIGFDWSASDPRHVSWEERFEQLQKFKVKSSIFDPLVLNAIANFIMSFPSRYDNNLQ